MTATTKPPLGRISGEDRPVTVPDFLAAKSRGVRLTMLTAYDYTMARLLDAAGVDGLLVGDSLGMVVQGHEHSLSVTLDEVSTTPALVPAGAAAAFPLATWRSCPSGSTPRRPVETAAGS